MHFYFPVYYQSIVTQWKTSEINMWGKVTKSETHHQSERRQLRKKAMATRALKTYKYCQKIKLFLISFFSLSPTYVSLLIPGATFFWNKCCCNAVLQVGLLLKICTTQWTDIFLKYSSSKLPETSSFSVKITLGKKYTPISSTFPDTHTHRDTDHHHHQDSS